MGNFEKAAIPALVTLLSCAHVKDRENIEYSSIPATNSLAFQRMIGAIIDEFAQDDKHGTASMILGEGEDMELVPDTTITHQPKERAAAIALGILEGGVSSLTQAVQSNKRDHGGPYLQRSVQLPFNVYVSDIQGVTNDFGDGKVDFYEAARRSTALEDCSLSTVQWPRGLTEKNPDTFIFVACAGDLERGSLGTSWMAYANFQEGTGNYLSLGGPDAEMFQLHSNSKDHPFWFALAGFKSNVQWDSWPKKIKNMATLDIATSKYPKNLHMQSALHLAIPENEVILEASVVEKPEGKVVSVFVQADFFDPEECPLLYKVGDHFYSDHYRKEGRYVLSFEDLEYQATHNEDTYRAKPYEFDCPSSSGAYTMLGSGFGAELSTRSMEAHFKQLKEMLPRGKPKAELINKSGAPTVDQGAGSVNTR